MPFFIPLYFLKIHVDSQTKSRKGQLSLVEIAARTKPGRGRALVGQN